jgi:hypothetical protein
MPVGLLPHVLGIMMKAGRLPREMDCEVLGTASCWFGRIPGLAEVQPLQSSFVDAQLSLDLKE